MKRLVLIALAFFLLTQAADVYFSWATPGFPESNPFARDASCAFVLHRGIAVKAITSGAFLLTAALVWIALTGISVELGAMAFSGLLFYWTVDALMSAVIPNLLLWMGWYVSCGGPS